MTRTAPERARARRPVSGPRLVLLLGPAFVAAIAYVDPGNVAANLTAGARYGYLLVWVLVAANLIAVLVQYQSAKLGLVTGRSLPELLGQRLPTTRRRAFWVQAELIAAATDLAEVIGGAIALHLLFGIPLVAGGVIVGLVSIGLLAVQSRHGQRPFELVIGALLLVITVGFLTGLVVSPLSGSGIAGGLVPRFDGPDSVLLAASMLGATVMPHAVYLHSSLSRDRHGVQRDPGVLKRLLTATRWDLITARAVAAPSTSPCSSSQPRASAACRAPTRSRARTRPSRRRSVRSSAWCSRSGCSRRGSRRPRWAPTRARRSWAACCT